MSENFTLAFLTGVGKYCFLVHKLVSALSSTTTDSE